MKILGLDFETTGLDASQSRVIEIGAVVWETTSATPLALMSELVKPEDLTEIPQATIDVHGITMEMIDTYGIPGKQGFQRLLELAGTCQYVVAHNAAFDRSFFEAEVHRYQLGNGTKDIKWIDTMTDVPYPASIQTRKLTYLAAEHGLLNHHSHRAVTDVLVMLGVLKNYGIDSIVERSLSPSVQVVAKVSFDEKDKAKDIGFRWSPKEKIWHKEFKEIDLVSRQFPFEFEVNPL